MKNIGVTLVVVLLLAVLGVLAYKQHTGGNSTSLSTIALAAKDNTQTFSLKVGQKLTVTLNSPGDGGYMFDNPEYDTSLIHLDAHTHAIPTSGLTGDFGSDTWSFTGVKAGATDLTITTSRPWSPSEKQDDFTAAIAVQ